MKKRWWQQQIGDKEETKIRKKYCDEEEKMVMKIFLWSQHFWDKFVLWWITFWDEKNVIHEVLE